MELNKEQIIKALECCANGGWCIRDGCPLYKDDEFGDIEKCTSELTKNSLALIKELTEDNEWSAKRIIEADKKVAKLTEENESLYQSYTNLERKCARLEEALDRGIAWIRAMNTNHIDGMKILKDLRDRIRADTVREMQEALEQRIHSKLSYHGWYLKETVIAEIAKEMLEGGTK